MFENKNQVSRIRWQIVILYVVAKLAQPPPAEPGPGIDQSYSLVVSFHVIYSPSMPNQGVLGMFWKGTMISRLEHPRSLGGTCNLEYSEAVDSSLRTGSDHTVTQLMGLDDRRG